MAYDEDLANRVRELLAGVDAVTEMRMFGGLAFLVGGNMAVAVSSQGGLMVRCAPADLEAFLAEPHTGPMVMNGREMAGWLRVERDDRLETWVQRGAAFARTLPAKG
jgi:TfoX/Sxy family transcriptional regulator of competence genes